MEGLKEIATAYYKRSNDLEKNEADEFLGNLGANRDGKVSFTELRKSVNPRLSRDPIFSQLDQNGDGFLDFDEALAVYYMVKKLNSKVLLLCDGCQRLLVGPYFSCLLCLGGNDTFDLCCSCYRERKVPHEHLEKYLVDHHSLLSELRERRSREGERGQRKKREMEELRQTAEAHYEVCSPEVQRLVRDFFKTLDTNEDGRVDLSEFLAFVSQQGHPQMHDQSFFNILDHDGNGTLDFSEVKTLYYIIKSGRPFCGSCRKFMPGIFFSCVECFKNSEVPFNLCCDCYRSAKCKHDHDDRVQFLDNYTLLEAKRDPSLARATGLNSDQTGPTTSNGNVQVPQSNAYMNTTSPAHMNATCPTSPPSPNANYSNAIVPAVSTVEKWNIALRAIDIAVNIASVSTTMCKIL